MATTDARSGFRLPWSSDRGADTDPVEEVTPAEATASSETTPVEDNATAPTDAPANDGATPDGEATTDPWTAASADPPPPAPMTDETAPTSPAPQAARKPNKFLADLTKAMQAAAEEARSHALQQLQADAKTHIETIHGRSSTEAASLRRQADDDVAAVREWSKAEITRVREETEQKITDRKNRLETEIEEHAAVIEREIDAVQRMVSAFEGEMAAFFERLLGEDDPTRFATMAENLPEPPSFDELSAMIGLPADAPEADAAAAVETPAEANAETDVIEPVAEFVADADLAADAEQAWADPVDAELATVDTPEQADAEAPEASDAETTVAETAAVDAPSGAIGETANDDGAAVAGELSSDDSASSSESGESVGEMTFDGAEGDEEVDREAAFAAIQAAAEAAASAEVAADAAARAEAVADVAIEIIGNHEGEEAEGDPRYAALALSPDYAAAEAEALATADGSTVDGEEIPVIGDDALAARLAGLVPGKDEEPSGETASTQVVVVGLISVASIASFKRHLGRLAGVRSVGVSSGPDGEFVFAVTHSTDTVLRDAIPSLPSFQARVTSASDGAVHVTAHDPEADA